MEICPKCKGKKMVDREKPDVTSIHFERRHPREPCDLCNGTGKVSGRRKREYVKSGAAKSNF